MQFKLDLVEDCRTCSGFGRYHREGYESPIVVCEVCFGMGLVPTDDGAELLAFLHKFTEERESRKTAFEFSEREQQERENGGSEGVPAKPHRAPHNSPGKHRL